VVLKYRYNPVMTALRQGSKPFSVNLKYREMDVVLGDDGLSPP